MRVFHPNTDFCRDKELDQIYRKHENKNIRLVQPHMIFKVYRQKFSRICDQLVQALDADTVFMSCTQ